MSFNDWDSLQVFRYNDLVSYFTTYYFVRTTYNYD